MLSLALRSVARVDVSTTSLKKFGPFVSASQYRDFEQVFYQSRTRQFCSSLLVRVGGAALSTSANMSTQHKDVSSSISKKGEFIRNTSSFRDWITADGSSGYKAEADRYHLYVSLACPWAHRTLITRKLKGLEDIISFTVVDWLMGSNGWRFNKKVSKCSKDPVFGFEHLREVYHKVSPEYVDNGGRITVPVLFDKKTHKIVSNESSEIIRMFNKGFNQFCKTDEQRALDFYPDALQKEIDEKNDWIYPNINNGVYRCGFARSQEAYDQAVGELFGHLDKAEEVLNASRYLAGDRMTEADIRLYTTLIRFDKVYHGHFKCNKKQLKEYPNLWGFLRDLYQRPAFKDTTDFEHIRKHYMVSHVSINPFGIVSVGPDLDFESPHGRAEKFTE